MSFDCPDGCAGAKFTRKRDLWKHISAEHIEKPSSIQNSREPIYLFPSDTKFLGECPFCGHYKNVSSPVQNPEDICYVCGGSIWNGISEIIKLNGKNVHSCCVHSCCVQKKCICPEPLTDINSYHITSIPNVCCRCGGAL